MTAFISKLKDLSLSDVLFEALLVFLGFLVLVSVVFVKSETAVNFWVDPLLLIYSIFVTCFQLSRIVGAILHRSTHDKVTERALEREKEDNSKYEPFVSFVIPCKDEGDAIASTINRCYEVDYPKDKLEVIAINDGSSDNTLEEMEKCKLQHPNLKIINWQENRGKRHGMAAGFKESLGEIIIQLDSDSYIKKEDFRNFILPFRNPEIGAVCAHADPSNAEKNWLTKMQAAYYFMSFRILKAAESAFLLVLCCSGCSSAYRRDVVLPIMDQWLDEKFLGLPVTWGDDRSLTNWVIKGGFKTIYTDKVQAYTACPETFKKFLKQQVRWKKGWFVNSLFASRFMLIKHPFVALTYFFPLFLITFLTPIMAVRALVITPISRGVFPVYYILGVALISVLVTIYYRKVARNNKYWPYLMVWSGINMIFLSTILFYALGTIQNRKWGTR
jgi:hyaluronan synthase